eukprot:211853_1
MSEDALWTFIQSSKATKLVPLKLLHQFILSLSKPELVHLIQHYLQSKLSEHNAHNADGLTRTQTLRLFRNERDPPLPIDQQIMSKLNKKYGNKYRKKVISKIQQSRSTASKEDKPCKPHLLSIPPHVLAYSFQFLRYTELCKVQSVCTHFVYLNKRYPALTHYYFALNRHFCQKAMCYKIPIASLKRFKHIDIQTAYCNKGGPFNGGSAYQRTRLFQYLLKRIIKQSKSNLDVLTIDAHCETNTHSLEALEPFCVLLYLINEFKTFNISALIWKSDSFKPQNNTCTVANMLLQIGSNLATAFPNLKIFKQKKFGNGLRISRLGMVPQIQFPLNSWRNHVLRVVYDFGKTLEVLDLTSFFRFSPFDIFGDDTNMIQIIAQNMLNLKTLYIATSLPNMSSEIMEMKHTNPCTVLNKLHLELKWNARTSRGDLATIALKYLFSTFIGITEFEFTFDTYSYYIVPGSNCITFEMDWKDVLYTLITNKDRYSMNPDHEALLPLESLCIDSLEDVRDLMTALSDLNYFALKYFSITVSAWRSSQDALNELVMKYFVPYLKLCDENHSVLKDIAFLYTVPLEVEEHYLQPLIHILSNIPRTVTSMRFKGPYWRFRYPQTKHEMKIKEVESTRLVKQLSHLLSNKNNRLNLETISMKSPKLSKSAETYLLFLFGFNNNIYIDNNNNYCLHFP